MARSAPMEEREVWIKAGAIFASHGELTADYIIDQLSDAPDDRIAVEDWRRIATALDAIREARPQ
jgi:hypothetical protein